MPFCPLIFTLSGDKQPGISLRLYCRNGSFVNNCTLLRKVIDINSVKYMRFEMQYYCMFTNFTTLNQLGSQIFNVSLLQLQNCVLNSVFLLIKYIKLTP